MGAIIESLPIENLEAFYRLYVKACKKWIKELDIEKSPTVEELVARETIDTMARDYRVFTGKDIHLAMDYENYIYKVYEGNTAQDTRLVYQEEA